MMNENELSRIVVNSVFNIHTTLGPGLLESVYEEILAYELKKEGLDIIRQQSISLFWDSVKMENGFRADLIVNKKLILELKSVEKLAGVHYKQLLTYLKITDLKLGLLINFNEEYIKNGIHRIVNKL